MGIFDKLLRLVGRKAIWVLTEEFRHYDNHYKVDKYFVTESEVIGYIKVNQLPDNQVLDLDHRSARSCDTYKNQYKFFTWKLAKIIRL